MTNILIRQLKLSMLLMVAIAVTGCGMVYKADIQQGNVLDQRLVNDLRPGMTKRQVALILGTPAIASPFHHDRWDYIATLTRRGEEINHKLLSLTFDDNRLVKIEGDYKPEEDDDDDASTASPDDEAAET